MKPGHMTFIAQRIAAHLRRFEADPKINREREGRGKPYYNAGAGAAAGARRITVVYVSYQGASRLTRAHAELYLAWLDAGNVGRHFEALRIAGIDPHR